MSTARERRPPGGAPPTLAGAARLRGITCGLLAGLLLSCGEARQGVGERVDAGSRRALTWLLAQQDPDGAWRSRTYGALKGGDALTPLILKAIAYADPLPGLAEARGRALAWLRERQLPADGGAPLLGPYPVYDLSLTLLALQRLAPADDAWRGALLGLLRSHQLDERLGWTPADQAYGGWGYSRDPPRRPPRGRPPFDADLSSTLFALGALRVAGVAPADPAIRKAQIFVERCQNLALDGTAADPGLDDGGFFFTPTNALQNKAGQAGRDAAGRLRYRSYGSLTADGLRALLRCGLPADHPRVVAARRWLERHFRVDRNPGAFPPGRLGERASSHLYWCWSSTHAFRALVIRRLDGPRGAVSWPEDLAAHLLELQRPDGAWSNPASGVKEDDPLIATAFSLATLNLCRLMIE